MKECFRGVFPVCDLDHLHFIVFILGQSFI